MDVLADYQDSAVMSIENDARYATDKKLMVNFYVRAVKNNHKSDQQGRPIFDEVEYVRIIIPGDNNTVIDNPVNQEYRIRFAEKYERFKKGLSQSSSGTPLEMWPQMTVGLVAELKAMQIFTVEQLAELSDSLAQRIMGSHELRRRAQVFLDSAKGEAVNTKMASELEKRDVEINALKSQLEQLIKMTGQKTTKESK